MLNFSTLDWIKKVRLCQVHSSDGQNSESELEVCGVRFLPSLLRLCVLNIDSCSRYDSWLQNIYRLLRLFDSCHNLRTV